MSDTSVPNDLYVVIIAGGVGTRLWPLSRKKTPKQFLQIFNDGESLIQQTFNRIEGLLPESKIFAVAPKVYEDFIIKQLPKMPFSNFIAEPSKRGTTAAVLYSADWVQLLSKNPSAVVHFLVGDDHIEDDTRFRKTILAAYNEAKKGRTVVFGVKPRYAATGYGYIKVSEKTKTDKGIEVYDVDRFQEKPDKESAERYLKDPDYFWHGSGFMLRVDRLLSIIEKNWPKIHKQNVELQAAMNLPGVAELNKVKAIYEGMEDIPFDYTILEKSKEISMVEMEDTWDDLGSWAEVFDVFKRKGQSNVVLGSKENVIQIESTDSMIHSSGRLVALVGLDDMIVIETPDAILVCHKDKAQEVKQLVEKLKTDKKEQYL